MNRLQRLRRSWKKTTKPDESQSLTYICRWVDSLHNELKRNRNDPEFQMDLLDAASEHFVSEFSDIEKSDAFVYVLGLLAKR